METLLDKLLRKAKAPPVCRDERCCGMAWQQLKARSVRAFLRFDAAFDAPWANRLLPWVLTFSAALLVVAVLA